MNTTQLRSFATEARTSLLSGVKSKMNALGFKDNGSVDDRDFPIQAADGTLFQNEIYDVAFYGKWMRLHDEISRLGFRQVCEEGAYTWFNRLMAIQILAKNGLFSPVLDFESPDVRIPLMVKQAHDGIRPDMSDFDALRLNAVINDDNRITDQFTILIVAYCQSTPILYKCFGALNDFTELLLPTNILASNGFLSLLNGSSFITDADYHTTELIGWLYQFYISERKDEVFASFKSGHKAEAEDIPAATQIFTPNWIVKYMAQNTLGRLYLDNNPTTTLRDSWQYLVDLPPYQGGQGDSLSEGARGSQFPLSEGARGSNPSPTTHHPSSPPIITTPESLTFADLSCGSGHILNEAFDILFAIYKEEGYTRRQAIKAIFEHNLTGVDIDTRARQLATFALMLKACQQWPDAINCEVMPRVLDMPNVNYATWADTSGHMVCNLELPLPSEKVNEEITECFVLMQQAQNLGSIMKFKVSDETREYMKTCIKRQNERQVYVENFKPLFDGFELILALTDKYAAVCMNPPYMGNGNMNADLAKYVKDNYEDYKSDLFAVFMKVAEDRLLPYAKYGMINMQSWMFLSSFEKLRTHVIDNLQIDNMLHLGPRTFDEIGGEVVQNTAFVLTNAKPTHAGYYFRLVGFAPSELKQINFLNCCDAIRGYGDISKLKINLSPYCFNVNQSNFKIIPGYPIGYWVSEKLISIFATSTKMGDLFDVKSGLSTGDNTVFIRFWQEIDNTKLFLKYSSDKKERNPYKWIPYSKGGGVQKWYGNNELVVNWENEGEDMKRLGLAVFRNPSFYFRQGITWSGMSSSYVSYRYIPDGFIFDSNKGPMIFTKKDTISLYYIIGFLNTKVSNFITSLLNPTVSTQIGDIVKIPFLFNQKRKSVIEDNAENNIHITHQDWDAHETSWDFQENELLRIFKGIRNNPYSIASYDESTPITLQAVVEAYKTEWECYFRQLHKNEEELNRQFIEIYGLQDELTPDVPLNEVTILQQGEISIENNQIVWHDDEIIRQFISYAVGCIMGRYRLDRPGLHIAHPNPNPDELAPYPIPAPLCASPSQRGPGGVFTIDDDAIIPLMPLDSGFPDCAAARVSEFIKLVFGEDNHAANKNFLEKALGKDLESYINKDFYADHKKRYQNRPIYWLFSSSHGAFQCLVYMHRMTPYTVERIRSKYLLPYMERLTERINDMNASILKLTTAQARALQKMERDLKECREYHDMLHPVANQCISIDLDDGVLTNYAKFARVLAKLK